MKAIRHRFHRSAYGQGIQVVIQKDHQTQTPGGQQTPALGLNAFNQRTPKRVGAALLKLATMSLGLRCPVLSVKL